MVLPLFLMTSTHFLLVTLPLDSIHRANWNVVFNDCEEAERIHQSAKMRTNQLQNNSMTSLVKTAVKVGRGNRALYFVAMNDDQEVGQAWKQVHWRAHFLGRTGG